VDADTCAVLSEKLAASLDAETWTQRLVDLRQRINGC
jgi:hypothetical protein